MEVLDTRQELIGSVKLPNPEFGDIKLNVFPFEHTADRIKLPKQFIEYEDALNEIMSQVPIQEGATTHYITIDSKFFSEKSSLRREGIHMDGNFCADIDFSLGDTEIRSTWGGTRPTWCGTTVDKDYKIITKWVSEHEVEIPFGQYVSDSLGGLIVVSNEVGCKVWTGEFKGRVGDEGELSSFEGQFSKDNEVMMGKDEVWLLSSNTPHESLIVEKGKRRTFLRITLAHNYVNSELFSHRAAV